MASQAEHNLTQWLSLLDDTTYHVRPLRNRDFPLRLVWAWVSPSKGSNGWIIERLVKWIIRVGIISTRFRCRDQNIIATSEQPLDGDQGQVRPMVRRPSVPFRPVNCYKQLTGFFVFKNSLKQTENGQECRARFERGNHFQFGIVKYPTPKGGGFDSGRHPPQRAPVAVGRFPPRPPFLVD
jgi:hypothetical protein